MSSPLAGALMTTLRAPASRCARALSASVNRPVDSRTMSTPRSRHGSVAGSLTWSTLISRPSMIRASAVWSTVPGYAPYVESCLNRRALISVSTRSLTATTSTSGARSMSALRDWRPMRPKPLMPTRVAMGREPPVERSPPMPPGRASFRRPCAVASERSTARRRGASRLRRRRAGPFERSGRDHHCWVGAPVRCGGRRRGMPGHSSKGPIGSSRRPLEGRDDG